MRSLIDLDALHATRLLQVEERPFQRVTRNLLSKDSHLKQPPRQLPSPPPEGGEAPATEAPDDAQKQKYREEILLDFAALESSITRIQLIQSSNQRERERYAAEKAKILQTAQAVKDNTTELRAQLAEAQRVLDLRKGYDRLAAKLINPDKLKPRDQTKDDIAKTEKEIEDLQQENADFEGTWITRREAFDRVVNEGQAMIRVIKGIKEPEEEKDDPLDGSGEEGAKDTSRVGTPAPDSSTPTHNGLGGRTPLPESGDAGDLRPMNKFLDVEDATRASSRIGSPSVRAIDPSQDDVEMTEESLEPQPKDSRGMEATVDQVITPAAPVGAEVPETQAGAPETMDES